MMLIGLESTRITFKYMLEECHYNRNKTDNRLEDKMNTLLHKYDIKREAFLGGNTRYVE